MKINQEKKVLGDIFKNLRYVFEYVRNMDLEATTCNFLLVKGVERLPQLLKLGEDDFPTGRYYYKDVVAQLEKLMEKYKTKDTLEEHRKAIDKSFSWTDENKKQLEL